MATGAFFAAFGYKLFVKAGTSASAIPSSSSGLTRILSVDNAGIQGTSDSTAVLDYDSEFGFQANLITGQSYTIPCSMNLDVTDEGYQILKEAALEAASGTLVQWFRETPVTDGSNDAPEYHAGLAQVGSFSEDIVAGNIAKVSFDLIGFGAYEWSAQAAGS
jgi:hypothetical protein